MTTRFPLPSSLPARPLATLLGAAILAATAGWLTAQQPAKPASAPQTPLVAVVAPTPKPATEREEPTSSLIQGDLIYKHLGEFDPFWPPPAGCKPGDTKCDKAPIEAKGCKKFKLEEMILTGVTDTNGLKVAMLSAENKPYFVKAGDQCRDAQVLEIDVKTTCVKWRQVIPQTENNIRPYKDVTSCLKAQAPR